MARTLLTLAAAALFTLPLSAQEPVDLSMVTRIREEGFQRSQVLETVRHLTDVIGPRLTGSPQMKEANEWTRRRLEDWGLSNAHLEPYEFGRGWSFSRTAVHMVRPRQVPLFAIPRAYTPGTAGPVRGTVMAVSLQKEADLETWRGKLAGKILLLEEAQDLSTPGEVEAREHSDEDLRELARYKIPKDTDRAASRKRGLERAKLRRQINEFLVAEKVLATINVSSRGWGVVRATRGGSYEPGQSTGVPSLVLAPETYNHLLRLVEKGQEVELEVEVEARFHDDDRKAYNTVAEIPGTDRGREIVMAGAHLDSWHGSAGATDNATGSAVVMEAVRILKALGVKPRRTIRVALWSGEEQALLGSGAYVAEHFGSWTGPKDPEFRTLLPRNYWGGEGKLSLLPGHAKLSAYFNLDNGSGRIRGIFAEDNAEVRPIFEAWLAPFHDLGADTVTLRGTGDTDHESFLDVGLPGFQFIQDELDYSALTHHSNLDVYDHVDREALMQSSVVLASFLYHAAMRPEKLPRRPVPNPLPR